MYKIKDIVSSSKTFALLLNENPKDYELLTREALFIALKENCLNVSVFQGNPPEFNEQWENIIKKYHNENEKISESKITSILIPKKFYHIKEVSLEENSEYFSLNIDSNNAIEKDSVMFEKKLPKFDVVFFFGEQNSLNLEKISKQMQSPSKENIICINKEENESVSKNVSDIIEMVNKETKLLRPVSTLLFASLLIETGAEKNKTEQPLSFTQLLGRAMARTRNNQSLRSSWIFISREDIEKTGNLGTKADFFKKILKKSMEFIPNNPISVLIWQNEDDVQAIISEKNSNIFLPVIADFLDAKEENSVIVTKLFNNFSEAELEIQNAIKEALLK